MGALEVLAFIFAVFALTKLAVIYFKPKAWGKVPQWFAKKVKKAKKVMIVKSAILVAVVGYFVFANMNIVQVIAAMLFTATLVLLTMSFYPEMTAELPKVYNKLLKNKKHILHRGCLVVAIWTALALWALYKIFF